MIGYRLLYLQNDKGKDDKGNNKLDFIKATKEYLERKRHSVEHCTGYKDINDIRNFNALILNEDLKNDEEVQLPINIIRELKERRIEIPIVLLCNDSDKAEKITREEQMKGHNIVAIGKDEPKFRKKINDYLTEKLGILLDIGITGAGRLGTKILDELRGQSYINSINVHSEYYKSDYSRLWIPAKVERAGLIKRGFQSIGEMCREIPGLDLIYVTAGKHGEAAPIAGIANQDRNAAFFYTMNILYPRLKQIRESMEKGYFKGLVVLESGPQDIILQYIVEKMGFPADKITGVSPDEFRAKFILRDRIREILINTIITRHGKSPIDYDSTKSNLEDLVRDIGVQLEGDDYNMFSYLKCLNVEDIALNVIGGRSWPVPLYHLATIKGEPLFSACPELSKTDEKDRLIERVKKYGWDMMEIVSKDGRTYVDSSDECLRFAYERSRDIGHPKMHSYCWHPNYKMEMIMPNEIIVGENNELSIKLDEKRKPLLDQYSQNIFENGLMKQKNAAQEKIEQYETSRKAK